MEYEGLGFDYKKLLHEKYLLYFALGLVLAGVCYFYVAERFLVLQGVEQKLLVKHKEVEAVAYFKSQHEDVEAYKRQLQKENAHARQILPKRFDDQAFLTSLDESAQGISLTNVILPAKQDVAKHKSEPAVKLYPVKIQFQGDYFAVLSFLQKLEKKHYALEKLKIKADKVGYLECSVTVLSYVIIN